MNGSNEAERIWNGACALIEERVSEKDFQTWILELGARSFDGETLTLEAPFGLFRDRVKQSFLPTIEASVAATAKRPCQVVVVVGQLGMSHSKHARGARQLAEGSPREGGNPLFLYGGVGLGKTHLLLAVAHALRTRGKRVLYYQGEDFTRRMVEALQGGRMEAFHREFRGADALLIDDVQFLAGKKRTQQELYHVFNLLHQSGKPIALASDRPPDELEHLEKGLQSRFAGGLLADLGPLDRELRLRILKGKLTEAGIHLDDHILDRLAVQLQGSVREIEGLVSRLRAASNHQSLPLDDGVVETMITPYLSRRGPIDLDVVIDTVAWVHGLTRDELLSRDRSRRVAWPRHIAAYMCRKLTAASLPEIGHALGGRNHTSILRAVRSVAERQSGDTGFAAKLQQMEKMLGTSPQLRGRMPAQAPVPA